MAARGYSIDLGPELDPPYTREWGWMDDDVPPTSTMRAKGRRSIKALARQYERVVSRRSRGPNHIPERELPAEHEAALEGRPVEVPGPMESFAADVSMDALHEIAQAQAEKNAA